jgi:hypothetical protein
MTTQFSDALVMFGATGDLAYKQIRCGSIAIGSCCRRATAPPCSTR